MRMGLLVLAMALLAACQQPVAPGKPDASDQPNGSALQSDPGAPPDTADSAEQSRYFAPEMADLRKQLMTGLVEACFAHLQAPPDYETCVRRQIVVAFDDSGQGKPHCMAKAKLDAFADCVVVGNTALDAMHRLHLSAPADADFWAGKEAVVKVLQKALILGAIANCGSYTKESAILACSDHWLTASLAIPDALSRKCPTGMKDPERGVCLGQAASLRFMREHIPRLSGMGA